MDYKCRINRIIERAKVVSRPLRDVCAVANVSVSTVYRWQQDDANPRLRSMLQALDAMEADLTACEQKLVEQLTRAGA